MTDEHTHGLLIEDAIADAQTPISDDEIMLTIKRISKQIEAIGQDEQAQPPTD